jgi:hypothetical protein
MDTALIEAMNKFILLVLMTQLGKTFTTILKIISELECDDELGRSIHLIFTMNTLLSNKQFAKRLYQIERDYGKGSIVVFSSSNKCEGLYKHVKTLENLLGLMVDSATCPKVVVMCSNEYRFEDGYKFVDILNRNRSNIDRVFAYFDELHNYITPNLRTQIESLNTMDIVKNIYAMTATPLKIFQKQGFWSKIRMIILDHFNEEDYAGYKDMIFNLVDDYFPTPFIRPSLFEFDQHDENTLGFVRHILDRFPEILDDGTRTFIPAHVRRKGHLAVRKMIFERKRNAVVVVLNGVEKTLVFLNSTGAEKTIDLGNVTDEEVCETIAKKIADFNLKSRPLVITGFLCVGMGQTLTHKNLGPFTSAIISHLDLANDELYQVFGRVTGRTKKWDNYIQTQIYCPTKIQHRIHVMEECARRLALDYSGEEVSQDDYLMPMNEMGEAGESARENLRKEKEVKAKRPKRPEPIEHNVAFTSIDQVNKILTEIFKKPIRIKGFYKPNGSNFELSTRLNTYYRKKMAELVESDRLTFDRYKLIPMGMNISSKIGTGQQYMVYPVYPNEKSSPSEVRYYVRYLKPQDS